MHITVKHFFTLIKFIYRPGNGYILQVVPNAVLLLRDCELVQTLDIGGIHDFMLVVLHDIDIDWMFVGLWFIFG